MSNVTLLCRENETAMRAAIMSIGQARIAEVTGASESTISRWVTGELQKVAAYLAAANLRPVPADQPDITPAEYQALATLASVRVAKIMSGG